MTVERHLILQELTLPPSTEWLPRCNGWLMARVAEGMGYWLQQGAAHRQLNPGDGLIVVRNANGVVRASQLGPLKLQLFTVQPQYLNGLLTVTEWHQLEVAPNNPGSSVSVFTVGEPLGQKFSRLADQSHSDRLPLRCALLQLWANAVAGLLPSPASPAASGNKLRDHFRELVGQMTEAELSERSLTEVARQLHCSERHFSRLFREEFGVPFRARQIELRLQRARQLLADSHAKIINVAYDSGYRHLGLFNAMFKKRFGVTPSEWRQQNLRKNVPAQPRNQLSRFTGRVGVLLALLGLHFISPAVAQINPATTPAAHDEAVPTDSPAMAKARAALNQTLAGLDVGEKVTNAVPPASNLATTQAGPEKMAQALAALRRKMAELDARAKDTRVHVVSTNAGPRIEVEKYLVTGNSLLPPDTIGQVFTNIDGAFGTNVTFDGIHTALTGIQAAYRERGFVTVSVNLPQQRLTNATVKVQVTEGRLAAINVTGNRYFSSNNVMRALPSLHPDMFLNSHVFQRELDLANASRDRQIYPVIGPGPEPGTSELTLKVKDRLPLHARLEINNEFTPNTPDLRLNFSAQYDNLWGHEHQIGLQYGSAFEKFKGENDFSVTPFDDPLVANYSAYYRLPLGGYRSVQEEVNANPGSFGYSEATHQFRLPPATGRPELTFYASRSISDTGVQRGSSGIASSSGTATNLAGVVYNPLTITTNSAGDNVTLNEDLGSKLSLPLPQMGKITATLSLGADFKRYRQTSYNTNEVFFVQQNPDVNNQVQTTITPTPQSLGSSSTSLDYLPLNVGLNGSMPDALGTTYFNAQANFNVLPFFSRDGDFANAAYTTNAHAHYVTLQLGVDRVQTIYRDWSVKLHADGQWANGALFSNEQYGVGGTAGVRGYTDGEFYGDTGWRVMLEPQTPSVNIGMVDGDQPFWVRVSVFMDYGQAYLLEKAAASASDQARFWGAGLGLTANIGDHWDARLSFAWPLISSPSSPAGDMHIYFGVGAQF